MSTILLNGLVGQIGPVTIALSFKYNASKICTHSFAFL